MKTILILAACVCGAISVLYAAVADGGAVRPALPPSSQSLAAGLERMAAPKLTLGALAHKFAPVAVTPGECDMD